MLIFYNICTNFNPIIHLISLNHVDFSLCFAIRICYCRVFRFCQFSDFSGEALFCQDAQRDSQQRADIDCEFSKEYAAYMKGNVMFPKRDFIRDLLAIKCSNERVLR
jgi:hypothetical protein